MTTIGRRPTRSAMAGVGLALLAAACGPSPSPSAAQIASQTPSPTTVGASAAAVTAAPPTASPTMTPSPTPAPSPVAFDLAKVRIQLTKVVGGLNGPVDVVNAGDGSDRLFVIEQLGRIRIVKGGELVGKPFLDISGRVGAGGERGLLGMAFAPDFPTDPRLFVNYTDHGGNTVISSFTVPAGTPDQADPASERILLRYDQPFPNHNGGGLAFGPDGDLYIAVGDGGSDVRSGADPMRNGQNRNTLLGKLLRIRPGAADGSDPPYTIPADAPFVGVLGRPEIRAFGLRNPWRFSFDRATGDLWIGDVGLGTSEEVDLIRASAPANVAPDFGWSIMEGSHCLRVEACKRAGLTLPITEYDHRDGSCAIIGGYVARDPAEATLDGGYVYGDACSGNIWVLDAKRPAGSTPRLLIRSKRSISSFGEDEAGRLYLTDLNAGELVRIEPAL